MLRLKQSIVNLAVMSLRTGGRVATAHDPIINPNNLKIEGWYCSDTFSKQRLVLLAKDVRDFVPQGIAIDDHEVLAEPEDLVRLKETLELGFQVIGKQVLTDKKRRIGKVADYALDTDTMKIQKLYVSRPVFRSMTDAQLSIDRSQIVEITNRKIVIRDVDIKVDARQQRPAAATS